MESDFKKFVEQKRSQYKTIGKVFCPLLNEEIVFNAKGFYHLRYNGFGKERSKEQQIFRMESLDYSIVTIRQAQKVSAHRIYRKGARKVEYWRFDRSISKKWIAVVILRKIGAGGISFYSAWKERK